MKLPIEASDDDGILTKNGTMIYGKEDDAVTIGVQPLKDETGNVSFEGVRTLITNCKMCSCNRFDRCGYSYCGSESCKSSKIH